jgi:hypothetical protein
MDSKRVTARICPLVNSELNRGCSDCVFADDINQQIIQKLFSDKYSDAKLLFSKWCKRKKKNCTYQHALIHLFYLNSNYSTLLSFFVIFFFFITYS